MPAMAGCDLVKVIVPFDLPGGYPSNLHGIVMCF